MSQPVEGQPYNAWRLPDDSLVMRRHDIPSHGYEAKHFERISIIPCGVNDCASCDLGTERVGFQVGDCYYIVAGNGTQFTLCLDEHDGTETRVGRFEWDGSECWCTDRHPAVLDMTKAAMDYIRKEMESED